MNPYNLVSSSSSSVCVLTPSVRGFTFERRLLFKAVGSELVTRVWLVKHGRRVKTSRLISLILQQYKIGFNNQLREIISAAMVNVKDGFKFSFDVETATQTTIKYGR